MIEYSKPTVEIISFLARQALATSEDVDNNELPLDKASDLSFGEAVEPWD